MKQVVIKKARVSLALVRKLEAAGIAVTLIISSVSGAQGLERGDLDQAIQTAQAEVVEACMELHTAELKHDLVAESQASFRVEEMVDGSAWDVCGE